MKVLLYSGLLYLAGVAVILVLQPSLMFTEEGIWKEFGIGRNPNNYTWMPFWLFAIIWAILSYIIVLLLAGNGTLPGVNSAVTSRITGATPAATATTATTAATYDEPLTYKNFIPPVNSTGHGSRAPKGKSAAAHANSLIPGYYILNREITEATGTPKYIYLGPEPPGMENSTADGD